MEAPKRGSDEWVREKTNFVVTEAAYYVGEKLDELLAANAETGSVRCTIDTRYFQIDADEVVRLIKEFIMKFYQLDDSTYVLHYTYDRDYEVNKDYFKLEIVFNLPTK